MNAQDIIVYCIVAFVAVMIAIRIYRQLRGKDSPCNCTDCDHCSASAHCKDTWPQKTCNNGSQS